DIRNLAAQVEMQELEAVLHPETLQLFEPAKHLGDGEAEFRAIAAGPLPASAPPGGQLDSYSDLWPDANLRGVLEDEAEFGVFLDNGNHLAADLLAQHRHFDELGILEAVADDRRIVIRLRHNGEQFRLGARLEAEAVFPAKGEHFLNDLALLVHFDGK